MKLKINNIGYIIFLFVSLSIIGGILEILYMLIVEQRFTVGGFFHLPIRPIYGFGGLLLYLLPINLKKNDFILFMSSFVVCSIFEYLSSLFLEIVFNRVMWNYSDFIFNINGRICLIHSIIWGLLGLIFYHLVEPLLIKTYMFLKLGFKRNKI